MTALTPPALGTKSGEPPLCSPLAQLLSPEHVASATLVLVLSFFVGIGTGIAVVFFHYLISWTHHLTMEGVMGQIAGLGAWTLACIPTLGGIVIGLMRWWWDSFSTSVSDLLAGHTSSPGRAWAKLGAAAVSLGTGASLGPEGPSVEIGAYWGHSWGRLLHLAANQRRLLLAAGAAAGLAAGFNAPVAGVFLALELVLGSTFSASGVSVVLVAAVMAALVSQVGLGGQPAFTLPVYQVSSPLEFPLYLGLGVLASLVSIAYRQTIRIVEQGFAGQGRSLEWLGRIPVPLRPALGGLLIGITALWMPQVLGVGYETVEAMLQDVQFSLGLLVVLLVTKLLATAISLGSGLVGGIFAPALFLGASLGEVYGKLLSLVIPLPLAPPAYAMVGMAAVLAGSVRAPLTSVMLLFEMTRDYRIILPLMAAVSISAWLVERFHPQPVDPSTPEMHLVPEPGPQVLRIEPPLHLSAAAFEELCQANPQVTLELTQDGEVIITKNPQIESAQSPNASPPCPLVRSS